MYFLYLDQNESVVLLGFRDNSTVKQTLAGVDSSVWSYSVS